jgi:hypothetical protein
VAGTFDSAARAVGLLPHRLVADQAADMTVTQGGETHGEELRHVERNAALMDDAGVRHTRSSSSHPTRSARGPARHGRPAWSAHTLTSWSARTSTPDC